MSTQIQTGILPPFVEEKNGKVFLHIPQSMCEGEVDAFNFSLSFILTDASQQVLGNIADEKDSKSKKAFTIIESETPENMQAIVKLLPAISKNFTSTLVNDLSAQLAVISNPPTLELPEASADTSTALSDSNSSEDNSLNTSESNSLNTSMELPDGDLQTAACHSLSPKHKT